MFGVGYNPDQYEDGHVEAGTEDEFGLVLLNLHFYDFSNVNVLITLLKLCFKAEVFNLLNNFSWFNDFVIVKNHSLVC